MVALVIGWKITLIGLSAASVTGELRLPVWECDSCGAQHCVGSVAELSEKAGRDLSDLDLHRPFVDEVSWACGECAGTMQRVPDLMDVWFDSGAMPLAQWHYPFENKDWVEKHQAHVADFICEAIDQTRGWFYTLHALSTMLYNRPCFKNVICLGHILDEHGFKMSKSRGNIVDPWSVLNDHGADALRWYLYTCTAPGNPRRFSSNLVGETVRKFLLTLWNTYSFFITYANLDNWSPGQRTVTKPALIDSWALSRLQSLVSEVTSQLDAYNVTEAAREIEQFVDQLSNWYLRRNRRRFWKSEADADKDSAYQTLYHCLLTVAKLLAPFAPFISEEIYRNLTTGQQVAESIHLADWPTVDETLIDAQLESDMAVLLKVVELGRSARAESGIKVRQPLAELLVHTPGLAEERGLNRFLAEVRDELNVKAVRFLEGSSGLVNYRLKPNLPVVGKKFGKKVPALRSALAALTREEAQQIADSVKAEAEFIVHLPDEAFHLRGEDVLLETSSPEGFAVAEDAGFIAALNTEITDELRSEGLARDLVRIVQDSRKEAGLQISDHILLSVQASAEMVAALSSHVQYICVETLAEKLSFTGTPPTMYFCKVELGEEEIIVAIEKI